MTKNNRKLLIINQFFPPDFAATGQLLESISKFVSSKNIDVEILTTMPNYSNLKSKPLKIEKGENLMVRRFNTPLVSKGIMSKLINGILFSIKVFFSITLKNNNIELILYTSEPPFINLTASLINKLFNISFIYIIYDLYPDVIVKNQILKRGNILIKFWEKVNQYVFSTSKEIIVLDSVMANKIKKKYHLYKSNINILPSFTNTKKIKPISKKENWFSKKYNPENKFIAIYSGNQGRCHDLKTIIETALILKKTTDIYFIFIGNGYQNKFLNQKILELKLDNCFTMDYLDKKDISYSLNSADIAFVTINEKSNGLIAPSKIYGHLAAGTPIAAISPKNTFISKLVKKEKFGKWFKNGESNKLASWLIEMKDKKHLSKKMGELGRKYVEENASEKIICSKYLNIIEKYLSPNTK